MADAAPMAIFRDLCSSLLPVVVVNASEDAEAVCLKNGLTFADMIAPFMNLNSQHHVRGPVRTYVLPSLRVRCVPAHELATPHIDDIDDHLARVVEASPPRGLASGLSREAPSSSQEAQGWLAMHRESGASVSPWFAAWFRESSASMRCQQHDLSSAPLALVCAVSTANPDPIAAMEALAANEALPQPFQSGHYDPAVRRVAVLLHDVCSPASGRDLHPLADALRRKFSSDLVLVLPVNSLPPASPDLAQKDVWAPLIRSPLLAHPAAILARAEPASEAAAAAEPGAAAAAPAAAAPAAAAPAAVASAGHEGYASELRAVAVGGVRGSLLSPDDVAELGRAGQQIARSVVLPAIEGRLRALNEHVTAHRRGLRNAFSSLLRGRRESSPVASRFPDAGAGGPSRAVYPHSSTESQTRSLADLLFAIGVFDEAAVIYRMARADFKSDRALLHLASAEEMAALCQIAVEGPSLEAAADLEHAASLYYEAAKAAVSAGTTAGSYTPGFVAPALPGSLKLRPAAAAYSDAVAESSGASLAHASRRNLSAAWTQGLAGSPRAEQSPSQRSDAEARPEDTGGALDKDDDGEDSPFAEGAGAADGGGAAATAAAGAPVVICSATMLAAKQGRETEAAAILRRTAHAEGEGTLAGALLLEQAALAFLHRAQGPQMRRHALHLVLAGESFADCRADRHAARALSAAQAVYSAGGDWPLALDHVLSRVAHVLRRNGHFAEAAEFLALLLRSGANRLLPAAQAEVLARLEACSAAWRKQRGPDAAVQAPGLPAIDLHRTRIAWAPSSEASSAITAAVARASGACLASPPSAAGAGAGGAAAPTASCGRAAEGACDRLPAGVEAALGLAAPPASGAVTVTAVRLADFQTGGVSAAGGGAVLGSPVFQALAEASAPGPADSSAVRFGCADELTDQRLGRAVDGALGLGEGPFEGPDGAPSGRTNAPPEASCVWDAMSDALARDTDARALARLSLADPEGDTPTPAAAGADLVGPGAVLDWRAAAAHLACNAADDEDAAAAGRPGRPERARKALRAALAAEAEVGLGRAVAVVLRLHNPLSVPLLLRAVHLTGSVGTAEQQPEADPAASAGAGEVADGRGLPGWLAADSEVVDVAAGPGLRALPVTVVVPPASTVSAPLMALPTRTGSLSITGVRFRLGTSAGGALCAEPLALPGALKADSLADCDAGRRVADLRLSARISDSAASLQVRVDGLSDGPHEEGMLRLAEEARPGAESAVKRPRTLLPVRCRWVRRLQVTAGPQAFASAQAGPLLEGDAPLRREMSVGLSGGQGAALAASLLLSSRWSWQAGATALAAGARGAVAASAGGSAVVLSSVRAGDGGAAASRAEAASVSLDDAPRLLAASAAPGGEAVCRVLRQVGAAAAAAMASDDAAALASLEADPLPLGQALLGIVQQQAASAAFAAACRAEHAVERETRRAMAASEMHPRSLQEIRIDNQRLAAEAQLLAEHGQAGRGARAEAALQAVLDDGAALGPADGRADASSPDAGHVAVRVTGGAAVLASAGAAKAGDADGWPAPAAPSTAACAMPGSLVALGAGTGDSAVVSIALWRALSGAGAGLVVSPCVPTTPVVRSAARRPRGAADGAAVSTAPAASAHRDHAPGFAEPESSSSRRVVLWARPLSPTATAGAPIDVVITARCAGRPPASPSPGADADMGVRLRLGVIRGVGSAAGARLLGGQVLSMRGLRGGEEASARVSLLLTRAGTWDLSSVLVARAEAWPPAPDADRPDRGAAVTVVFGGKCLVRVQ
ncbi:hypothetical protein FNF31_04965 [Cafeteria roenbergensis]|uniref:Uncharacterized protein n=2 Tax=Cafeteria roenbergensis TaxID=33653 RepID=A0A5A8D1K2_CAFRO|nr:hypothetical protein FNF31_04965 [Cafeteria roenbergensis]